MSITAFRLWLMRGRIIVSRSVMRWVCRCRSFASRFNPAPALSVQPGMRDMRAFIEATQANEVLLTAQHRDDQAETLLFRLLRGAGVRGLSGMPRQRPLGKGHLLRPLLDVTRAELEAYAAEHQLSWIEDPSNQDRQFSRNYLRHQVFPVLTERWPQAVATMARSAAHLSEAQGLLDELAQIDLARPALPVISIGWDCRPWSWHRWQNSPPLASAMH